MITKQRALFYFVGEQSFKDLPAAQIYDLKQLLPNDVLTSFLGGLQPGNLEPDVIRTKIAEWMLKDGEAIVDILTTTPTSRLRARKTHGGTKAPAKKKLQPAVKIEKPTAKPQPEPKA